MKRAIITASITILSILNNDPALCQNNLSQAHANRYVKVKEFKTEFKRARGIAVTSSGRIYAAGDRSVRIISQSGDSVSFPTVDEPNCIAISTNGLIFLGMTNYIQVAEHCGTHRSILGPLLPESFITSVAVGDNSLFVADSGKREIIELSFDGKIIGRFGNRQFGMENDSIIAPSPHLDVAVSRDGNIWVTNPGRHRMQLYSKGGSLLKTWGFFSHDDPAGFTGCCNPADFACLPNGYIVTADKGALARIRIFDSDGLLLQTLAGPADLKAAEMAKAGASIDLAVDGEGRIYALNQATGIITVFVKKDI